MFLQNSLSTPSDWPFLTRSLHSLSQTSVPLTNPVIQALSNPLTFRLAFPIKVALSDEVSSSLTLCPPLRGKDVKMTSQSFRPPGPWPCIPAQVPPSEGHISIWQGPVALGCGHSERMGLKA